MFCLEPKLFILSKEMAQNQQIFTFGTRMEGLAFAPTLNLKGGVLIRSKDNQFVITEN